MAIAVFGGRGQYGLTLCCVHFAKSLTTEKCRVHNAPVSILQNRLLVVEWAAKMATKVEWNLKLLSSIAYRLFHLAGTAYTSEILNWLFKNLGCIHVSVSVVPLLGSGPEGDKVL